MIDFIIVGRGLAAATLMHTFHRSGISFKAIGNAQLSTCSNVAAGIWNPVVFKRLTKSWLAAELVKCLNDFYSECGQELGEKFITQRVIAKPFTEEQEKKLWLKQADSLLREFLDPEIYEQGLEKLHHCKIPNGYGLVNTCGNLNVEVFLTATMRFFSDRLSEETFDHGQMKVSDDWISYKEIKARNIIFCEGYQVCNNRFFNWIPLKPAKGEILTISAPNLDLQNVIFNKNGFLMEVSKGVYKTGATYAWDDLSDAPTPAGLEELKARLAQMISCDYSVLKHEAGIRPSSADRRPIVGSHPEYKNLYVFNGLGTKGVMLAPFFVKNFVNFYLQKEAIHSEVNVSRFYNLYDKK